MLNNTITITWRCEKFKLLSQRNKLYHIKNIYIHKYIKWLQNATYDNNGTDYISRLIIVEVFKINSKTNSQQQIFLP